MSQTDWIADTCAANVEMAKMHLADFSDADMLARPCPGANHAAWQLGHLAAAEAGLVNMVAPDVKYSFPAGWKERFTPETSAKDDPKAFPSKAELLEQLSKVRQTTVKWIRTLKPEDLTKPGPEPMLAMAPTVGSMLILLPGHVAMHLGQIQVLRRKLGKKLLF